MPKKDHIIVERSLIQILSLECVFQRINTPDNYSKVDFTTGRPKKNGPFVFVQYLKNQETDF